MRRFPNIVVSAAMVLSLAACKSDSGDVDSQSGGQPEEANIPFAKHGTLSLSRDGEVYVRLDIEIAETDSTRTRGMMQRISIPEHSGMLFLFEQEEDRAFWMANTPLSLDLIFIDADSVITTVKKYMQPLSAQNVPSEGPSQFVLEVEAGYSDTIGIIEGDRVSWKRTNGGS